MTDNKQYPTHKQWNQATGRDGKLYTDGWNACVDAYRAMRAAQPPEGYVMVPVEPTEAMKIAAVKCVNGDAVYKVTSTKLLREEEDTYGAVYEAMLEAAPKEVKAVPTQRESLSVARMQELIAAHAPPIHPDFKDDDSFEEPFRAIESAHGITAQKEHP